MKRMLILIMAAAAAIGPLAAAPTLPTGERQLGQGVVEPAYNDTNGSIVYLLTPIGAKQHYNVNTTAPLYLVVYPAAVGGTIGVVSCQHQPMDNCADHGPIFAGLAEAVKPTVYGGGVWGHDHLFAAPPATPANEGDFHVAWIPVAVLFTSPGAAYNHITTLAQLNAAYAAGDVIEIPLPEGVFHGSVVSERVYNQAVPLPPAPPLP